MKGLGFRADERKKGSMVEESGLASLDLLIRYKWTGEIAMLFSETLPEKQRIAVLAHRRGDLLRR